MLERVGAEPAITFSGLVVREQPEAPRFMDGVVLWISRNMLSEQFCDKQASGHRHSSCFLVRGLAGSQFAGLRHNEVKFQRLLELEHKFTHGCT